jgi:FkbM family methyltransferase
MSRQQRGMIVMRLRWQILAMSLFKRSGQLETIGSRYGGWTIPSSLVQTPAICYCVGCGEDVTFDAILADKFGCSVWSYDPTPRAVAHMARLRERSLAGEPTAIDGGSETYQVSAEALQRWQFAPVGVWSKNETVRFYAPANEEHVSHSILNLQKTETYFEAQCRTLASLMTENRHTQIDLLKLDIEGAEYEVISSLVRDNIRPHVLCVEFDEGPNKTDSAARARIAKALNDIRSMGYYLAHRKNWDFTFVL